MARIKGSDWSHWNGKPDCQKAQGHGLEFVYVKIGEVNPKTGNEFTDDMYARNIAKLDEVGIITGAYQYFHPSVGASKQVRQFETLMELYGKPKLPPIVDLETADNLDPVDVASVLKVYLDRLEKDLNVRPIIYTSSSFWGGRVGAPTWGKDYYFFIAQYPYSGKVYDMDTFNYKRSPVHSAIADNVLVWQFSDNVHLAGMPRMDGNFWLKDRALLHRLAGKEIVVDNEEKPQEEPKLTEAEIARGQKQEAKMLEGWGHSHTELNNIWWKIRNL